MMPLTLAALLFAAAVPAFASDEADELVPGRMTFVKDTAVFRFAARPPRGTFLDLPDPANDPVVEGAELRVVDTGGAAGAATFALPATGWQRLPGNLARPLKGYRYKGAGSPTDPCRVVVVKERVVRAACRGPGVTLSPPFSGEVAIALTVGTDSKRYCASFGGITTKNTETVTRRRLAPAPEACFEGGAACACGETPPERILFDNGVGSGTCGTVTGGTINNQLACGGLYFGGGLDAVPLPIIVPDFAVPTEFGVEACTGSTLTVRGATDAESGGENKACTVPGCFFGPPLPVPNPDSVPTSTCLYNVVADDASGTLACDTGAANISLPLDTGVYLTGDLLPNRCEGGSNPGGRCTVATQAVDCPGGTCQPDPELQPCPICNPTTNVCNGGMDNGQPCEPGSTESVTGRFPTSQDCRVSELVRIGTLDIELGLTTGTSSDTAVPSGTQERVFCGFCRDADESGAFQGPPAVACESNADCAQPFESCEQRSQGAFANGLATEIAATGSAAGALIDFAPHPTTLATVFCIPPVYNAVIDGQADLPGPGALTLPGTIQLALGSPSGAFLDGGEAALP
jgi:hypothetical protein